MVAMISLKFLVANWTTFDCGWTAMRPAFFGAITRCIGSVGRTFVVFAADLTGFCCSVLALLAAMGAETRNRTVSLLFHIWMKLDSAMLTRCRHFQSFTHSRDIITLLRSNVKYVAVTLERLAGLGLDPVRLG